MVDSRLKLDPPTLFHCYLEVVKPLSVKDSPEIARFFPDSIEDEKDIRKQIPKFCYPCETDNPGVQYFTFVLTDIDGKFRYGFCRYPPRAASCMCVLSYLPWFEFFYNFLDSITDLDLRGNKVQSDELLSLVQNHPLQDPGTTIKVTVKSFVSPRDFKFTITDTTKLPTIPDNRNLTEYFAAIDPENMVYIFISMLFERRIIITSKKLSLLTAVVHGSVSLLYPMQWQHIYVPILPPHLIDYCCAPMPFLVGVHSSMMDQVRDMPMNEVVILDADTNEIQVVLEDLDVFPPELTSRMKGRLKKSEKALDDYVSSQFLQALATLIGGYRDALKFTETDEGDKIVFDDDMFVASRSGHIRVFLEKILELQSFRQFIEGRLEMLNAGIGFADIFEQEITQQNQDTSVHKKLEYEKWRLKMKKSGGALKKNVHGQFKYLNKKANELEIKGKMKTAYKGSKSKVKSAYKGIVANLKKDEGSDGSECSPLPERKDLSPTVRRNASMPSKSLQRNSHNTHRHTMHSFPTRQPTLSRTKHVEKRNSLGKPPRPPPPPGLVVPAYDDSIVSTISDSMLLSAPAVSPSRYSEPNLASLLDLDTSSSTSSLAPSSGTPDYYSAPEDYDKISNGSFVNCGFDEPHYVVSEEDIQLEHTPIPNKPSPEQFRPAALVVEKPKPERPPAPNLAKSPPAKPPRPPLSKRHSGSSNPPKSPDLLLEFDSDIFYKEEPITKLEDSFKLSLLEQDYEKEKGTERPNSGSGDVYLLSPSGTMGSPFYSPSANELFSSLDTSFFNDTLNSLSQETRQMVSKENSPQTGYCSNDSSFASPGIKPSTNPFDSNFTNNNSDGAPISPVEMRGRSPVMTHRANNMGASPSFIISSKLDQTPALKPSGSSQKDDPFASMMAETRNSVLKNIKK